MGLVKALRGTTDVAKEILSQLFFGDSFDNVAVMQNFLGLYEAYAVVPTPDQQRALDSCYDLGHMRSWKEYWSETLC